MTQADPQQPQDEHDADACFAAFMRRVPELIAAREAANPTPPRPAEPWVDKPTALRAAEDELFRCEIAMRICSLLCRDVARCKNRRCRRTKRCRDQEEMRPLLEASRAEVARQQAKWQPPAPRSPGKSRKKGRTGVRP